jgi:hypothetical protein
VWAVLFAFSFVWWFVAVGTHPIVRQGEGWVIVIRLFATGASATGFVVESLMTLYVRYFNSAKAVSARGVLPTQPN